MVLLLPYMVTMNGGQEQTGISYLQFNFSTVSLDGFPGSFENKNNWVLLEHTV